MSSLTAKMRRYSALNHQRRSSVAAPEDISHDSNAALLSSYNANKYSSDLERHGAFDYPAVHIKNQMINRDRNGHWWVDNKLRPNFKGVDLDTFEHTQKHNRKAFVEQVTHGMYHSGIPHNKETVGVQFDNMMSREIVTPQWELNRGRFDGPSITHNGSNVNMDRNHEFWKDGVPDEAHEIVMHPQQFYRLQANRNPDWKQHKIAGLIKYSCIQNSENKSNSSKTTTKSTN